MLFSHLHREETSLLTELREFPPRELDFFRIVCMLDGNLPDRNGTVIYRIALIQNKYSHLIMKPWVFIQCPNQKLL